MSGVGRKRYENIKYHGGLQDTHGKDWSLLKQAANKRRALGHAGQGG